MAYIGQSLTEGTRRAYTFVATSGQTTFNAVYGVGAVDVYQNGILLQPSDYNSSSGSSVVLGVGAAVNDEITIIAHNTFSVADTVSSSQGGTFAGNVSMSGTLGVTGAVTAANGLTVDDDGATPLTVDRATNDGAVIDVQRDGVSIGGITTNAGKLVVNSQGSNLTFAVGGTSKANMDGSQFYPQTDGGLNLSHPSVRWQDLYLSGGAYIGGTGAANKLDDYEIGTAAMTVTGSGNNAAITTSGTPDYFYVKIGDMVQFQGELFVTSVSGATGAIQINLPITSHDYAAGSLRCYNAVFGGTSPFCEVHPSGTKLYFSSSSSNAATQSILSNGYYFFSISYRAS
jgi:hypothetical protein